MTALRETRIHTWLYAEESDMRVGKTMQTGMAVAAGVFLESWLLEPLLGSRTFSEGLYKGCIVGLIVLVIYALIGLIWKKAASK